MGKLSLKDLGKSKKLNIGLPTQEERIKFKEEVVLGKDGVYLSYLSDFFDVVYKIEDMGGRAETKLGGVGVPEVEAKLEIAEKIPSEMIYRMVAWYRHVNEKFGTEATMQVFYDKSEGELDYPQEFKDKYPGAIKRDGKFVYVIPEQNVTGGFVSFAGDSFPEQLNKELYEWTLANYEPVLNIHSHNSMNAFWSGTDDANELPLYNRLCLVIGKVHTDHPQFRFSWNFEGKRHHFEDTIDTFIQPLEIKTSAVGLDYEETEEKGFNEALRFLDFDKLSFDERWDNQIYARGRYGNNRGAFKHLSELDKKDYSITPEESEKVGKLIRTGDYLKGRGTTFKGWSEHEQDVEGLIQNAFYDDEEGLYVGEELDEEDLYDDEDLYDEEDLYDDEEFDDEGSIDSEVNYDDPEAWKRALMDYKEKLTGTDNKKDSEPKKDSVGLDGGGFRHTFRSLKEKGTEQSKKPNNAYQKYRQEKLREESKEGFKKYDQTSIWDDIETD